MKKRFIFAFIVIASVLLFIGASPWEGSAAIAPNGELPTTGYYIATNAYPRNTVVDITNLETGKSTRVIVSNTLTGPGLLAVVSRQAGELIGMRDGSVSRLRMIQPTDPMAYMRFTQSMKDGNPEYDSGNVITEEKLVEQVYKDDTYKTPEVAKTPEEPKSPLLPGYIVDEPEWGGSSRLQIVDVPGYLPESNERIATSSREPEYDSTEFTQRDIEKDVSPKINERPPVEVAKEVPDYNPDSTWETTEAPLKEVVKDVPVFITEAPRNEVVKDVSPWQEKVEVAKTLYPVESSPNPPPSNVYGIDPNDIIPGIVVATPEKPANSVNTTANVNRTPVPDRNLSVNTIDRLDRGKYYVQVAAMSADLVENTLKQIDRGYAPVVFKGTDNIYRILIGPLNQGESAAVLSRFKSIGYKDAFVRKGS
ncbi:SPOR domain-containing protein [Treponema sp. R6D11]